MPDLLSVQEALDRMLKRFYPLPTTSLPLERCLHAVLAGDITAPTDLPPFTNSGMDGFAVKHEDTAQAGPENPVRLAIVMDIPAGSMPPAPLQAGQAARIMTGAAVPEGATAIVPIEDTNLYPPHSTPTLPAEVQVKKAVQAGAYLRRRGQDIHQGQTILHAGQRLRPQDLGMLASLGFAMAPVYRRPRVALLSSGDELLSPTEALAPGKIHDSNSFTLAALCEQSGAEVVRLGVVADDPQLIQERLELAIDHSADLIVTSAGVSVGEYDYMRQVIEQYGNLSFWRVNMRPGKPLAFGSFRGIPLIGLPGNPVSAYVGFQVFVFPVLRRLAGLPDGRRPTFKVTLAEPLESDGRESYLRAILIEKCGKISATLAGHQGSGNLYSVVKANALIKIPSNVTALAAGAEVDAWLLDEEWVRDE
jgi:molybdopterin molybdotransferase